MKKLSIILFALAMFTQENFRAQEYVSSLELAAGSTFTVLNVKRIKQDQLTGNGYYRSYITDTDGKPGWTIGLRWINRSNKVSLESGFYLSNYTSYTDRSVSHETDFYSVSLNTEVLRYSFVYLEVPMLLHYDVGASKRFNLSFGLTPTLIIVNRSRWAYQNVYTGQLFDSTTGNAYWGTEINNVDGPMNTKPFNVAATFAFGFPLIKINEKTLNGILGVESFAFSSTTFNKGNEDILRLSHLGYFLRLTYPISSE
jgi:hypothetical protein